MSTYFKIINLDKKERGLLATFLEDAQAQEMIAQRIASGQNPDIGYDRGTNGTWVYKREGYLDYLDKEEAGAIFMHACGNLWGRKGPWYGDRVVILCDSSDSIADQKLWEKSETWIGKYFGIPLEDLSFNSQAEVKQLDSSRADRKKCLDKPL